MQTRRPIVPRLGITLTLQPALLETLYQDSATRQQSMGADERRSLVCCLIVSSAVLVWQFRLPMHHSVAMTVMPIALILAGMAQYLWFSLAPPSFLKHRSTVRAMNRWVFLLHPAALSAALDLG
jgi:hypothetical protein